MNEAAPYLIALMAGLTVMLAVSGLLQSDGATVGQSFIDRSRRLALIGEFLGVAPALALAAYLFVQVIVPLLFLMWRPPLGVLFFAGAFVALLTAPWWAAMGLRRRALKKFEAQLPPFTDQLVSSVRGDVPLLVSLQDVVPSLEDPLRTEIATLAEQANKGQGGIDRAIVNARKRYTSKHYSLLLSIIHIFSRQGGNLIEPMQNMSRSFKEVYRLEAKLQTAAASARTTFWIVNLALLIIIFSVSISQPHLIDQIFESLVGIGLFLLGIILYAIGTLWLLSMTKVEI